MTRLRRDLRCMTADGATYSVMVGVGETYVAAFALAIGLGEVLAGLVSTLPMLAGELLQIVTPRGVRRLGSHRRWVILCATVQSLSFLPLAIAAIVGAMPAWLLFVVVSIYWACNMGAGPAWNTWVTMIVPGPIRARYFGWRSRLCQLATLCGIALGGTILALAEPRGWLPTAFALLFLAAFAARAASTAFLARQSEPEGRLADGHRRVGPRELIGRLRHGPDARLLSYMLAVQFSVHISGAYFTPYMLKELEWSKGIYALLIGASFVAKAAALPFLGRFAHRFGARRLLRIGGLGLVPLTLFWVFTDDWRLLLGVQVLAGSLWACYELATFLLMLETIKEEERTSVLTSFNVANASATAVGSLMGGALLAAWGFGPGGYMLLFAVSAGLRVAALGLLARVTTDAAHPVPLATTPLAVRSNSGSVERPVLPSIDERALAGGLDAKPEEAAR